MKKLILICLIGLGAYNFFEQYPQVIRFISPTFASENSASDKLLENAYKNRQSDLQTGGTGHVLRILSDDLKGSRHQRFILKLSTGQTLLVAHNIDLAPRINNLNIGDQVEFYGEYEWNSKGGVMHWTHHDPRGNHEDGWLIHNGRIYK